MSTEQTYTFTLRSGYWWWSELGCELELRGDCLIWTSHPKQEQQTVSVPIFDIMCTNCRKETANSSCLDIHYVITNNLVKSIANVTFRGPHEKCEEWCAAIRDSISKQCPNRPKRLLVFVSPKSGSGQSLKVYNTIVEPIFKLCGVEVDLWVTSKPREPEEVLYTYDLSSIDGAVASGGDGTYLELLNGAMRRAAKDAAIDVNNPEQKPPLPALPMGFLPTGSRGFLVKAINGTCDVTTAVLAIVQGDTLPKDIMSIHSDGEFISYSAVNVGTGFMYQMARLSEKIRWMGPIRYPVIGIFVSPFMFRNVQLEIEILNTNVKDESSEKRVTGSDVNETNVQTTESHDNGVASSPQSTHDTAGSEISSYQLHKTGWEKLSGTFAHAMWLVLDFVKIGSKCVTNSGSILSYTMREGPYFENQQNFRGVWFHQPNSYTCDRVSVKKASVIKVKAIGEWRSNTDALHLFVDGESSDSYQLKVPDYELRLHAGLVKVYGRDVFR